MANIIYRTSITPAVPTSTIAKGTPLTNLEVDGNFRSLKEAVDLVQPTASPSFTGVPTVPTASVGTNTDQIASTGFVINQIASDTPSKTGSGATGNWNINASGLYYTLTLASGGTGATTPQAARTNLGATTIGSNLFTITNPNAISFPRFNADNTISSLDAASFRAAIGAGTATNNGTVTSVGGTGTVSGLSLTGTVTSSGNLTLGGTLAVSATNFSSQTTKTFLASPTASSGVPTFRSIVAGDIPTLNQNTTGTAAGLSSVLSIASGGTNSTATPNLGGVAYGTGSAVAWTGQGTAGQYLVSAGAAAPVWATIGSAGPTEYSLTNQLAFTATTTLTTVGMTVAANTKAIVRSIHVTNIGLLDDVIDCAITIGGTTNVYLAYTLPVMSGSSVELLKKPKVMSVNDVIKVKASIASSLQVIVVWEVSTDITNVGTGLLVTTADTMTDVFTASGNGAVLNSFILANVNGVDNYSVDVVWVDATNAVQAYYCKNYVVPADSSIEIFEAPKRIPTGHKIRVTTPYANTIAVHVSGKTV